jgi:hypothetical protein
MSALTQLIAWLNSLANAVGEVVFAPIATLSGWLSATLVAVATGMVMLVAFKYTSNQTAIKRVRAGIKANTLALKLFKDSALTALRAQQGMLIGAFWLLIYAVVPIVVMTVPVILILSQLALWYQSRPLHSNEDTVITVKLRESTDPALPEVHLEPNPGLEFNTGPVRILSQNEVCWDVRAKEMGYHRLQFRVGDQVFSKDFAVGAGMMRVSVLRPAWSAKDVLFHPYESPFRADSPVQSIEIKYPSRDTWIDGTNTWVWYWLIVSMVVAFCFKGVFKVNI